MTTHQAIRAYVICDAREYTYLQVVLGIVIVINMPNMTNYSSMVVEGLIVHNDHATTSII